jgi:hypothetical protein
VGANSTFCNILQRSILQYKCMKRAKGAELVPRRRSATESNRVYSTTAGAVPALSGNLCPCCHGRHRFLGLFRSLQFLHAACGITLPSIQSQFTHAASQQTCIKYGVAHSLLIHQELNRATTRLRHRRSNIAHNRRTGDCRGRRFF